jgi:hypothetical protein
MGGDQTYTRQLAVGEEALVAAQDAPGEEFRQVQGYSKLKPA